MPKTLGEKQILWRTYFISIDKYAGISQQLVASVAVSDL